LPDEQADSDSEHPCVDVPIPPVPQKQKARKSGEAYWIGCTLDSTKCLQAPDPIEDADAASNEDSADDTEQSSVTESDDDIVVIETDDPFFEDSKNDNKKLSKKLVAKVRF
jgi:hypothetical protein